LKRSKTLEKQQVLLRLRQFVAELDAAGVQSKGDYRAWAQDYEALLCDLFDYKPEQGMPRMGHLVTPHFHPELPLIGLNYSPLAHNMLYQYPQGWIPQLRMCRGITFARNMNLMTLYLPKFFNADENSKTKKLPAQAEEVLEKMDGHNGQHFYFAGGFRVKTRGSFTHRTSEIADEMMQDLVLRYHWASQGIESISLITEVIHPETRVICDYGERAQLVLIAAYDIRTLEDYTHDKLIALGERLGLAVVKRWNMRTSSDVSSFTHDPSVKNREGFVVRYANGERVKFKFKAYLSEMVRQKLSYSYLMLRWMDGRVKAVMHNLPEEVLPEAMAMFENLKKARRMRRDIKQRRKFLYELVPPAESTSYYRTVCRDFLRHGRKPS